MSSENSASIFNTLSDLPSQLRDAAQLLGEAMRLAGTLSQETLEAQRHKHLAYILSEQTQLNNGNSVQLNTNLNKVGRGCRLSPLQRFLFMLRVEQPVLIRHLYLFNVKHTLGGLVCVCPGGEETVPAPEVHAELPAVRRG